MFGMPGTRRADTADFVARRMGWSTIHTGQLLKECVSKKEPGAEKIQECMENSRLGKKSH